MTKPTDFATNTVPNSAPTRLVEFSRGALDSNLDSLRVLDPDAVIDLRCDAYGHGADWVEAVAREHEFVSFLVDGSDEPSPSSSRLIYGIDAARRVAIVSAEIVNVKTIAPGDSVSYGYTWTAARNTTLALVSLGFADGLPRSGSNTAHMSLDGSSVPVVGRIAMDQTVVDVTELPASVGDVITMWDSSANFMSWVAASNRDPLSLVTGLSWRVERSWIP